MIKVTVVIPTFKRPEKLKKCLDSVLRQTYDNWEVCVVINGGDEATYDLMREYELKDKRIWCKTGHGNFAVDTWNYYTRNFHRDRFTGKTRQDAIAWLVDDAELMPNYLANITDAMMFQFPDLDGVVGSHQDCPGHPEYTYKPYGQVLIGSKFIDRYEYVNYQVCCPDYIHFYQDEEMYNYALSHNKFFHCRSAILFHYHPSFIPELKDEAHENCRGYVKKQDDLIYAERINKNYLWGRTWETVGKSKGVK